MKITTTKKANRLFNKLLWLRANHGAFARVARELGCKQQSVAQVYWGDATSRRITEALKKRGAPVEVEG